MLQCPRMSRHPKLTEPYSSTGGNGVQVGGGGGSAGEDMDPDEV